jgi:hypothetical protein
MEVWRKKLDVDFGRLGVRSVHMDDTDELIIRLCTHVGMIMEDASIVALTLGGLSPAERADPIAELCIASERIERLMEAARVLRR